LQKKEIMADSNKTKKPAPKQAETNAPAQDAKLKEARIKIKKDAYGAYSIGGHVGAVLRVNPDLANRMIESGHAEIVN
jgi:hypothetical protein